MGDTVLGIQPEIRLSPEKAYGVRILSFAVVTEYLGTDRCW
jgi:hypothetical protein